MDLGTALTKIISTLLALLTALVSTITGMFGGSGGEKETTKITTEKATTVITTEKTTEKVTVTAKPTTAQKTTKSTATSGTFTFVSYGWGHGVGMSQEGAITMAKNGSTYGEILRHYYKGAVVKYELPGDTPSTVKYGGSTVSLIEFLCKSVKQEIGDESPKTAIMAQAGAIYSFLKFNKFSISSSQIAWDSDWSYKGTDLYDYVIEYLGSASSPKGKYVTVDGGKTCCNTVFGASVAGHTTDAESVWGAYYSYLVPVTSPEKVPQKTYKISSANMKSKILGVDSSITLSKYPADWIVIDKHDSSLNSNIGYVAKMHIGSKQITGDKFRSIMGYGNLHSHCFSYTFE